MSVPVCDATGELTAVLIFDRTQHPAHPGGVDESVPEVVGSARISLHPVGEIQVTQLLDTGGESSRHRVGLVGVRTQ